MASVSFQNHRSESIAPISWQWLGVDLWRLRALRGEAQMSRFESIRALAQRLRRDVNALVLASRDPRTPWYAKVVALAVVAYALSPIDLIPDFIPVLGYADDLVLIPLGVWLVLRFIPREIMDDCRARATVERQGAEGWLGAAAIVSLWLALGYGAYLLWRDLTAAPLDGR
jgi:uncharacterized membrane protein YkvA (DUF1232 family)